MNLLFLVEGEKTEPKVYRAWLKHLFPDLIFQGSSIYYSIFHQVNQQANKVYH